MYTNHINPVAQKNQDAFCTALFQLLLKKPLEKISVTELCHMADLDRTTFTAALNPRTMCWITISTGR